LLTYLLKYFLLNVAANMSLDRLNMADGSELCIKNGSSYIVSSSCDVYFCWI